MLVSDQSDSPKINSCASEFLADITGNICLLSNLTTITT